MFPLVSAKEDNHIYQVDKVSISSSENTCILVVLYTGNTELFNNLDWEEIFLFLDTAVGLGEGISSTLQSLSDFLFITAFK